MRRKVVAGNWKMNMTPSEAVAPVKKLKPNMENSDVDVIFCVPSIDIVPVVQPRPRGPSAANSTASARTAR